MPLGGLLPGEMSGVTGIPDEPLQSLISTPETMPPEEEVELIAPVLEAVAPEKEMEPSILVLEALAPEAEAFVPGGRCRTYG